MKILYVTDLHGDKNKYRKSLEIAMKQEIRVIVNGGDMLPKLGERHTEQPLFIKGFLSNYFSILQEHNITYLNMLGNDDLLSVDNLFEQTCGGFANVHNIAGKKICIDEYEFIGMNQILDHPFGCKDRVVTETDYIPQRQLSFFAGISNEYGYDRIFDWLEYSKTELPLMCGILKELPEPESPKKTVYVMHMPPAGLRGYPDRARALPDRGGVQKTGLCHRLPQGDQELLHEAERRRQDRRRSRYAGPRHRRAHRRQSA